MRILLFGSTGQVGLEILARAPSHGVMVEALSRADVDLADEAAIALAIGRADADLVINAAAYTAVDQAETDEAVAFAVNGAAPGAMARACRARDLPLFHISTDYVFDGQRPGAWTETDRAAPANAYGRSKLAGEQAVLAAGGRSLILRTSWVFSPHGRNFVKTMLGLAARPELRVVDDQHGRPTAAGDIAEILLLAARRLVVDGDTAVNGLLHFAGEGATTWRHFARAVFDVAGGPSPVIVPITTAEFSTPAARPANSVLDCTRLEAMLGVRPRPWRAGLEETIAVLTDKAGELST